MTNAFQMVLASRSLQSKLRKPLKDSSYITYVNLSVLGTGTKLSPPCLAVCVERSKRKFLYQFNLTPRRIHNKMEGNGILQAVFYTRLSWNRIAHGITLFLENNFAVLETDINIIGPPGLKTYLLRVYMYLLSKRRFHNVENAMLFDEDPETDYVDDNITVKKIFVTPESNDDDPSLASISQSTAFYICELKDDMRLTFDWEKLKSIGVYPASSENRKEYKEKERFLRKLGSGKPTEHHITGEIIDPKEYSIHSPPPTFIVMECPTVDHFKIICENETINSFANEMQIPPRIVVHITPAELFSSSEYQNWLEKFGSSCQHLILNEDSKDSHSLPEFCLQYEYHNLCSEFFPKPQADFFKNDVVDVPFTEGNKTRADFCTKYRLDGKEISRLKNNYYEVHGYLKHFENQIALKEDVIGPVKREITKLVESGNYNEFPKLCILGCGASYCSKYRTQPGFLLLLDRERSILMDCGVHSLLRVHQQFGNEAERILSTIKLIFISHRHIDHNIGFLLLLQEVVEARLKHCNNHSSNKVYCLMPDDVKNFYEDYCRDYLPSLLNHVTFFSAHDVRQIREKRDMILPAIKAATGLKTIWPVPVQHGVQTFGLQLITNCNMKIVYSSDTLPSQKYLVWEGREADLLIHDCLYVGKEWEEEALIRKHSSLKGALETAAVMRAKFTLLTHFTTAIPVVPLISTEHLPEEFRSKVACAYDHLSVSLSMLHLLPKMEPIFVSYYEASLSRHRKRLETAKEKQRIKMNTVNSLQKVIEK